MRKIRLFFLGVILFIGSLSLVSFSIADNDFEIVKNLDIYHSLVKELNLYYVDDIDVGKLVKTSIDHMLETLDPYTVFYPESEIEDYEFMTTGQYGGIGALIHRKDSLIVISDPYEGFPAFKAGLKAGDILLEIAGKKTNDKNIEDISQLLKGQANTEVRIQVDRPGGDQPFYINLTRQNITIPSVPYKGMIEEGIGYIRLSSFTQNCAQDVKEALLDLQKSGKLKSLVLDLRSNPGGLLQESVDIVNFFIDKGQLVVSTKGKVTRWNSVYKARQSAMEPDLPLVVLVDRSSASASEIVAGALQDLDRAVIIGQRTFGKGLVQSPRKLRYSTRLKVTTAKYYTPSGRCIQALDYSHRNPDGSVGKVPDSLISIFQTQNGREVMDGGGILPDAKLNEKEYAPIAKALANKYLIFDFATEYVIGHDSISQPEGFSITKEDYKAFKEFIKKADFTFETKREQGLNELIDVAKKEKYYQEAQAEFDALQKRLAHNLDKDLDLFEEELTELINDEVVGRYHYQTGRLRHALYKDPEIDTAIALLNDLPRYKAILAPPTKQ